MAEGRKPSASENRQTFIGKALGAEAKAYDFITPRPPGPTTNVIQSIGHLIKSCLGGGVVAAHATYSLCGLWTALVLNLILGIVVAYFMYVLAKSAQRIYGRAQVNRLSFPEVAEASFQISKYQVIKRQSRFFRYAVDLTIMIDLFGSCVCYQVLIAEQINEMVAYYYKDLGVRIYIAALLIPCILICMILTLKYLAPFSLVADAVIVIVAVATVVFGILNASKEERLPMDMPIWKKDVPSLFQFMGGIVFSMEGIGVTMPIENHMTNPHKIGLVLTLGMACVVAMVMIVGFFGYYGWADQSTAPITTNFPMFWFTMILKIALPLMIYVTFALNFWVPFNLVWAYIKRKHPELNMEFKERLYRALIVFLITLIAVAFPQVVNLMGVIGAFCLTNMGFIYPAVIELVLDLEEPGLGARKWRLIRFVIIFIFSMILMVVGTLSGIVAMIINFK